MYTAIDIETTGLTAADEITVVGFGDADKYVINYNADGGRCHFDHDDFDWASADREVELRGWPNEDRLLTRLAKTINEFGLTREGPLLVGYNLGGFDFQMLRTRMLVNDVPWVFDGASYLDIQGTFDYDFATKGSDITGFNKHPLIDFADHLGLDVSHSMNKYEVEPMVADAEFDSADVAEFCEQNDEDPPTKTFSTLSGIHELFVELDIVEESPVDPLEGESRLCCEKWNAGEMAPVVKHNLSDLKMTLDLVELVPEYVHDSELRVKRL